MKKSFITNKSYYFISLGASLMFSFYPLLMGLRVFISYIRDGYVNASEYPKYLIPYTPISFALILSVALLPFVVKLFKRFALPVVSALGLGLFFFFELLFEQITLFSVEEGVADIGSWQMYLCVATPEVMQSVEYRETVAQSLAERYSPLFKVHFYLIAILIVLAVIGVVYGFGKMVYSKCYDKRKPLLIQTAAVAIFIGLCILACFTAFYRTGNLNISALSSWLMSVFFVVFGLTAGIYAGSLLYFKKSVVSRLIPSLIAVAATFIMYIGELVLMGGVLFKFGNGSIFEPIGACPFTLIDFFVIALSGVITYLILFSIRRKSTNLI